MVCRLYLALNAAHVHDVYKRCFHHIILTVQWKNQLYYNVRRGVWFSDISTSVASLVLLPVTQALTDE